MRTNFFSLFPSTVLSILAFVVLLAIGLPFEGFAQEVTQEVTQEVAQEATNQVEMADVFRKDGKIYVVLGVALLVLLGLLVYLFMLDRRIKRLESKTKQS